MKKCKFNPTNQKDHCAYSVWDTETNHFMGYTNEVGWIQYDESGQKLTQPVQVEVAEIAGRVLNELA